MSIILYFALTETSPPQAHSVRGGLGGHTSKDYMKGGSAYGKKITK